MNKTELIELARELATEQIVPELEQAYYTFTVLDLKLFAQRIEQPHLQRIAEIELALQKQAKAALQGMDSAKRVSSQMLYEAKQIQSSLKPELIESERQANAVLTEENEKLQQQIEQLREALKEAAFIAKTFVDGYEDLANSVGAFEAEKASIKTARKQLKAMEQTK